MRSLTGIPFAAMLLAAGIAGTAIAADAPAAPKPHLPPSFGLIFASEQVADIDRSLAFYSKVFGMTVLNSYENDGVVREKQLVFPDKPMAGGINIIRRDPKSAAPGERPIHLVIRVHDIHATCDRVEAAGGKLTRPPAEAGGSGIWVGMAEDPDGHRLEIIQYK
jgi:lactoylglutathione lyase